MYRKSLTAHNFSIVNSPTLVQATILLNNPCHTTTVIINCWYFYCFLAVTINFMLRQLFRCQCILLCSSFYAWFARFCLSLACLIIHSLFSLKTLITFTSLLNVICPSTFCQCCVLKNLGCVKILPRKRNQVCEFREALQNSNSRMYATTTFPLTHTLKYLKNHENALVKLISTELPLPSLCCQCGLFRHPSRLVYVHAVSFHACDLLRCITGNLMCQSASRPFSYMKVQNLTS